MTSSQAFFQVSKILCQRIIGNNFLAPTCRRSLSSALAPAETQKPDKLYKKLEIEVRGNDKAVLKSYGIFATTAANHLGISVIGNFAPHKAVHERLTLLKSKHVHKKHRVQYETRTYFRFLNFEKLTGSTADTFLEYIQRNLPEGVAMKVTKISLKGMSESYPHCILTDVIEFSKYSMDFRGIADLDSNADSVEMQRLPESIRAPPT